MRNTTSARSTSLTWFDTAPEPTPSRSAATDDAWHRRVQWSTLLVPKPVRTSFWKRYASSFEPLALPKPASALGPAVSRIFFKPPAAKSSASSHVASRNTSLQRVGSTVNSAVFDADDLVVLHLVGELATHAAVRADAVDFLVGDHVVGILRRGERAGRARLHALAARDTGGGAHRIVLVEDDLGVEAAEGITD